MDEALIQFVKENGISLDYVVEVLLEREIEASTAEASKEDILNSFKKKYFVDPENYETLEKLYDNIQAERNSKLTPEELILLKTLLSERRQKWEEMKHGCGKDVAEEQINYIQKLFNKLNNFL